MSQLTPKQECYVRNLISGMSQREAYRAAYSCERWKDANVDAQASRTLAMPKVRARYDSLTDELAERVLWDRERAARELLKVRDIALEHIQQTIGDKKHFDANDKRDLADLPKTAAQLLTSSTAELNRMFGVYERAGADDGKVVIVDDV